MGGISKVFFEIPYKISYLYIERCGFNLQVKISELLDSAYIYLHQATNSHGADYTYTTMKHTTLYF